MGLAPIWRLRSATGAEVIDAPPAPESVVTSVPADVLAADEIALRTAPNPRPTRPPLADAPRAPATAPRSEPARASQHPAAVATHSADPVRVARIAALEWDELEAEIRACQACRLCERRKQAVPGVGDRRADWMLVGEGPGSEEDQRGEPFVGPAGKLLDAMLSAIGLKRGEGVYIANAVKCRPPHNRTPEADEIATCLPYLARQIELVRPRLLVALGRPAAHALLDTEISIGASRGRIFHYRDTPVVVTYHPAYLLRNQADKAKAWEDLCFARRVMQGSGGEA
ncbi:uracil-DNA glycosylase [Aromatoleum diolicum]|uniref:Type-4 uracil-DNA glycosylase n=1 Tax=Aromatoleum diolicum TaxID=75796 RepID=A0ABX1QIC0_9RHOO|nr:uracil-DNA glycosylase [Aromatoleum diolicum]NMG76885.1 uracil-DNA glycosylase [Aromatoleum diolicum]